jgi:hypothetical protein
MIALAAIIAAGAMEIVFHVKLAINAFAVPFFVTLSLVVMDALDSIVDAWIFFPVVRYYNASNKIIVNLAPAFHVFLDANSAHKLVMAPVSALSRAAMVANVLNCVKLYHVVMAANANHCLDACLAVMMLFATFVVAFKDARPVIALKFVGMDFNTWEIVTAETVIVRDATATDLTAMDAISEDAILEDATVTAEFMFSDICNLNLSKK